jgi:putative oxidoreductase
MKRFFATPDSGQLLFQRVALGLVMLPHGLQKLFGWYGGPGWSGTIAGFEGMGIPAALAMLIIFGESLGSLGLIVGFATRLAAFGIAAVMIGAIVMVHANIGFFMNWTGTAAGEGYEYHLLALALALPLVVKGGGRWSIDRAIAHEEDIKPERRREIEHPTAA